MAGVFSITANPICEEIISLTKRDKSEIVVQMTGIATVIFISKFGNLGSGCNQHHLSH
jgi:hypothetical protein